MLRKPLVIIDSLCWYPSKNVSGIREVVGNGGGWGIETTQGFVKLEPGDWILTLDSGKKQVWRVNKGVVIGEK